MPVDQPQTGPRNTDLPARWLLSDKRNDHRLERLLRNARTRIGFVYRHYHLPPEARIARFEVLQRICRLRGHLVILADSALPAREWGADGIYGAPLTLSPRRAGLVSIATVHDMREIVQACRMRADAAMLSPAFVTRSHPGADVLGPSRFRLMARHARMPVIALGGMSHHRAAHMRWPRWAAIDGFDR